MNSSAVNDTGHRYIGYRRHETRGDVLLNLYEGH